MNYRNLILQRFYIQRSQHIDISEMSLQEVQLIIDTVKKEQEERERAEKERQAKLEEQKQSAELKRRQELAKRKLKKS